MRMLRVALLMLALMMTLMPIRAFAISNPDSASLFTSVRIFRHVLETNDFLMLASYDIPYATPPTEPVSDTFIVRFTNGSSTQFGANYPTSVNHPDNGYNQGLASLYFSAAEVTSLGIVWGTTTYTVRLEANPTVLPTWDPDIEPITADMYSTATNAAATQTELGEYIIEQAESIGESLVETWVTAATPLGILLSTDGEAYFVFAIPGLRNMAPQVFQVQAFKPTVVPETFTYLTPVGANTPIPYRQQLFPITPVNSVVDLPIERTASAFGVSRLVFGFFLTVILMLVTMAFAMAKGEGHIDTTKAFVIASPWILLAPVAGFYPLEILFVFTAFMILLIGFIFFLARAS